MPDERLIRFDNEPLKASSICSNDLERVSGMKSMQITAVNRVEKPKRK